jgi:hypothetical protein
MPTGWTVETLHTHLRELIAASDRVRETEIAAVRQQIEATKEAASLAQSASDRAVEKAEIAAEKRFDSVNEFRSTLSDQQRTLMPRSEAEIRFAALATMIDALEHRATASTSQRSGIRDGWGYAVGAFGVLIALVTVISALSNR